MSADISRRRFDPANDYSGVLMQQGRVQLDADWNELIEILDRRWRAETIDIIGRAVVPSQTPEGFHVLWSGTDLSIGPGRIYVDGLLAENHGADPIAFDPVLAELVGKSSVLYSKQPYLPKPPSLPTTSGTHLVFLDVWQRVRTHADRPDLVEKAVGVDTTARLQTVWQVRVLANVGSTATCASPDGDLKQWAAEIAPSAGRLTTEAVGVPDEEDLCQIPPTGGYRGLDNRTYRVEIHDAGTTPTFKWSRDNGSVVTEVTAVDSNRTKLTVVRTRRDDILRFSTGDWVEVTSDIRELAGQPGEIRKVSDVNDESRVITLAKALDDPFDPKYPMRVRRWDQKRLVRLADNTLHLDLDSAASTGVIPVPAPGVAVRLEDGVQVKFSLDPSASGGGRFRVGDHWIFTARTADAKVEPLVNAPPHGIHHHYARLGLITSPTTISDCRVKWPPPFGGGTSCDCTVCVSPDDHNKGTLTIQTAIEMVKAAGGGKVCLEAGQYQLGATPIPIDEAQSLRLVGKGILTELLYSGKVAAVLVTRSRDIALEEFTLAIPPGRNAPREAQGAAGVGVLLHNSTLVRVQGCFIHQLDLDREGAVAIGLSGLLHRIFIRDNIFETSVGIATLARDVFDPDPPVNIASFSGYARCDDLRIADNVLTCPETAVWLGGYTLYHGETRITGNTIRFGTKEGIVVDGLMQPVGHIEIAGNILNGTGHNGSGSGDAIRAGVDQTSIVGNVIRGSHNQDGPVGLGNGIVLDNGLDTKAKLRFQVLNNTLTSLGGSGIVVRGAIHSAMIKQNRVENVNGGGIIMEERGSADTLSIANNHIRQVGLRSSKVNPIHGGIQVFQARHVDIADNSVSGVGMEVSGSVPCVGIHLVVCGTMKVSGNEVTDIGAGRDPELFRIGILVQGTFEHLEIVDNIVRRNPPANEFRPAHFVALVIQGAAVRRIELARIGFLTLAESKVMAGFFGGKLLKMPVGLENVAVRGNRLASNGLVPTVSIDVLGECLFHDNHCERENR